MHIKTPMEQALEQAELAFKAGEVPVGAVVVKNGRIISRAANSMVQDANPLAHAEIKAIHNARLAIESSYLNDCDLYVTLEPCTMCAGAIALARLRRVYYGAHDIKSGALESGIGFFNQPTCHHRPDVYSAILEVECSELLKRFFVKLRNTPLAARH